LENKVSAEADAKSMSLAGVRKETRQPITPKHKQSKSTSNTSTPQAPILFIRNHGQRLLEMAKPSEAAPKVWYQIGTGKRF
jgi:hypothetical protein